ncbi:MAG: flavin reductase family protein [Bacteroidota bacterium]
MTVDFSALSPREAYQYLSAAVAPRPICFASTVDAEGNVNLSPYSFFNVVSGDPPMMVFAPQLSGRDGSAKDTLNNVLAVPEVVINVVNHALVEQMSLTSTAYPCGVNEFVKAGLTEVASDAVRPPRVGESPVAFECVVDRVIALGDGPMAGNMVLARAVRVHVREEYLTNGKLDPTLLDLVGRMGGSDYVRASGDALFEIPKPIRTLGIGVDALPAAIRNSEVLTGNDLGRLGNLQELLTLEQATALVKSENLLWDKAGGVKSQHRYAQALLRQGKARKALAVLLV